MAELFLLLLAGAAAVSVWQFFDLAWVCWCGTRAAGQVVKLAEQETSEGGPVYAPVVEYRTGGQTWRIQPPGFSAPPRHQIGQEVPVYYFSQHPGQGRLVTAGELLKRFVIAAVLLFIAALLVRSLWSRVTPAPQSSESASADPRRGIGITSTWIIVRSGKRLPDAHCVAVGRASEPQPGAKRV